MGLATASSTDTLGSPAGHAADGPWRRLVAAHQHRLRHFIYRHIGHADDAEELVQQAFVEAVHGYYGFRKEAELSTWLYGIAKNLVRNYLSRAPQRRYEFVSDEVLLETMDTAPGPDDVLECQQALRRLNQALRELPQNMQQVLWLVGVEKLSYEAAAQQLSVPTGTVRSRVSRARSALQTRLGGLPY
ncbi:RNA polymerase sigma factor [Comamonas sp. GB3 AK4-5]|uniref:RNA polymerase sigma factor n=1 Tax=Comamonas sp. GB3 AK4-5 TaxID=3231487 RepID=UPI00351E69A3